MVDTVAQKMLARAARTAVVLDDAGQHVDRHEAVGEAQCTAGIIEVTPVATTHL